MALQKKLYSLKGFLDLSLDCNRRAMERIDWKRVEMCRPRKGNLPFHVAICNPVNCPSEEGWESCKGDDWKSCYFYGLATARENERRGA